MTDPVQVHAWLFEGVWRAEVSGGEFSGFGQGPTMFDAIEAAAEDFRWLQPTEWVQ